MTLIFPPCIFLSSLCSFSSIWIFAASPFTPVDIQKIKAVIEEAEKIIQQAPNSNAEKSMEALRENANVLKSLRVDSNRRRSQSSNSSVSNDSTISDSTMNGMEDFKFTYEEESDPETFFIPYVWEAIVCTVTASSLEWDRMNIKAFAIIHHLSNSGGDDDEVPSNTEFAEDVDDVV